MPQHVSKICRLVCGLHEVTYVVCSVVNGTNSFFSGIGLITVDGDEQITTLESGFHGPEPLYTRARVVTRKGMATCSKCCTTASTIARNSRCCAHRRSIWYATAPAAPVSRVL